MTDLHVSIVNEAQKSFIESRTLSLNARKMAINGVLRFLHEQRDAIVEAVYKDLRKPSFETIICEINYVVIECNFILKNLRDWMKPHSVGRNVLTLFDRPYTVHQPYGLVFVMGAWNYPIMLTLSPVIGAIAAGNCVVIKPSEHSPHTARLFSAKLGLYIDPSSYPVLHGSLDTCVQTSDSAQTCSSQAVSSPQAPSAGDEDFACMDASTCDRLLVRCRFDHIFYTGGSAGARAVYARAAAHLTPVTLELGGKCATYMDETMLPCMPLCARRVVWGRMLNCGQTCVAPDYLICSNTRVRDAFVQCARTVIDEWFCKDGETRSSFLSRIVHDRHFRRVADLLAATSGHVVIGGRMYEADTFIEPTIVTDVQPDDALMQEEIFGPVLPVLIIDSHQDVVNCIMRKGSPLSVYIFSRNKRTCDYLINSTHSGGVVINDTILNISVIELPFGGVGESGMGRYHGKYSFDTFSHERAILYRGTNPLLEWIGSLRYPPYTPDSIKYAVMLMRSFPSCFSAYLFKYLSVFTIGVAIGYLIDHYFYKYS